ncbi:MAG: transcriptional regulator, GntR family [Frankiales bacterium]|nr:transcriptional regulator, GntR family [Frankiales bacterium]
MSTAAYPTADTAADAGLDASVPVSALAWAGPRRRPSGTVREQVYTRLRSGLLLGQFPVHQRMGEERLAATLEVSRTPVREALTLLFADGLLERRADGGYYPVRPDVTQLRDLYELRVTLETRGVLRGIESKDGHDTALLEPLRDEWRRLRDDPPTPDPSFVEVDESFHVELLRASGNAALTDMLLAVNARIRPVRLYDFLTAGRIEVTIRQHLQIAETLLSGSVADAAALLQSHVGESLDVVERRAMRAITQLALRTGVPR